MRYTTFDHLTRTVAHVTVNAYICAEALPFAEIPSSESVLKKLFYKICFAQCSKRPFMSACLKFEFLGNLNNVTEADDILQHHRCQHYRFRA